MKEIDLIKNRVEHLERALALMSYDLIKVSDNFNDIDCRLKSLESALIVRDDAEQAAKQADSSDSFAGNGFCAKKQYSEHIQPISGNNSQKSPEYGINPSSSLEKCCGNCEHFRNEDANGHGTCELEPCGFVSCSDLCYDWKHRPFTEGEAVMWKTSNTGQAWKLGFYCRKSPFGHIIRTHRNGCAELGANIVKHFDTFDPYKVY